MNSRLKFRAFHKPTKKMLEVYPFCDKYVKAAPGIKLNIDEFEPIQQFLGIEGKDWWEGDILGYEHDKSRIIIVWNKNLACFGLFYNTLDSEIIHRIDYFHVQHCIKLGNIYENPELLKNKYYADRLR